MPGARPAARGDPRYNDRHSANRTNVDAPFTFIDIFAPADPDLTLTLEHGEPVAFVESEEVELGQFVVESIAPGEELALPVRIDIDRGYRESAVRIYSHALAVTREQVRDGYLLGDGQWFDKLMESYRSDHGTSPEFEEWANNLRLIVGTAFDLCGFDLPDSLSVTTRANGGTYAPDPHEVLDCRKKCYWFLAGCGICALCAYTVPYAPVCAAICVGGCAVYAGSHYDDCVFCCEHPLDYMCHDCPPPSVDVVCSKCDEPGGIQWCCPWYWYWKPIPCCPGCTDVCCETLYLIGNCTWYNCSADPNEKVGPPGHGEERFVDSRTQLTFRLYFENLATATAPAAEVIITDKMDQALDLSSFRVREFDFGSTTVNVPEGRSAYHMVLDFTAEMNLLVRLEAGVDAGTRQATFTLRALDPETRQLPTELDRGFLPPNDETGRGEGYVEFTIKPNADTPTGTVVTNRASIVFDYNDPIETNEVFNTIDSGAPETSVQALPPERMTPFVLRWDGEDDAGGCGLSHYEVYVRTDGGPAELWYSGTDTWAHFAGEVGNSYAFYSIGVDNVGNTESLPTTLDATTTVTGLRRPGDIDLDGDADLDDFHLLVDPCSVGPSAEVPDEPEYCKEADLNGDRPVDLQDFAVLQAGFGAP